CIDFGNSAELRVRTEDQINTGACPFHLVGLPVAALVHAFDPIRLPFCSETPGSSRTIRAPGACSRSTFGGTSGVTLLSQYGIARRAHMPEHSLIYRDIAMVFAGAFACGLLAWRLRQPILLGYVLAGLILSPLTPGPRVTDVHTFEIMAEIGVILLMFSVGIHFSIPELLKVKWVALLGAPVGILLSVGLGTGVGALLGWPLLQGIAVGCIISVASTMVMMRLLMDRNELSSESGRVMITLTLVEDIAVVILTILLPSLTSSPGSYAQVGWKIGRALLLLVPIVLAAWKLVPRVLARAEKMCSDELSLLLALTICLVVAAVTEFIGLSLALGAFVAGLLLGSSDFVHKLEQQTLPIRD